MIDECREMMVRHFGAGAMVEGDRIMARGMLAGGRRWESRVITSGSDVLVSFMAGVRGRSLFEVRDMVNECEVEHGMIGADVLFSVLLDSVRNSPPDKAAAAQFMLDAMRDASKPGSFLHDALR